MRKLIVNADYELQLFTNSSKPSLRLGIEFFLWWLDPEACLISHYKYSPEDLEKMSKKLGHTPLVEEGHQGEFWWGELAHHELEKKVNSKHLAYEWAQELKLNLTEAKIILSMDDLKNVPEGWLLKSSTGMSGRGHSIYKKDLKISVSSFPLIAEPLETRTMDLSSYYLHDEMRFIFYENIVDEKFQYRGTILGPGTLESLTLPKSISDYPEKLMLLQKKLKSLGAHKGFSVDAFFHENGFRGLCEINYRKTMGWITYQLQKKFKAPWVSLKLCSKEEAKKIKVTSDIIILSPDACPFVWILTLGETQLELNTWR
jgi:hypothetical protein